MVIFIHILVWLHLVGLGVGMAGGLAMSQVGPRLVASAPDQRGVWWGMAKVFGLLAKIGMIVLLVTGPLVLWLKYGGHAPNSWFVIKMALLAVMLVGIGFSEWGLGRVRRGDDSGAKVMKISGPVTTVAALGVILAAVFAFT